MSIEKTFKKMLTASLAYANMWHNRQKQRKYQ
jgi:hypothetical protein